jgi:hypothetical protein
VAVAVHIRGHVDDREEGNHDCRDTDRPQARLPVMIILQWSGTAGPGGIAGGARRTLGHNLARPLGARLLPKLRTGLAGCGACAPQNKFNIQLGG